jgi:hypothetical protein
MTVYINNENGTRVNVPDSVTLDPKFYTKAAEKSADTEVPVKTATGTLPKGSKIAKKRVNKR